MPPKSRIKITPEEVAEFRQSIGKVKPLQSDKVILPTKSKSKTKKIKPEFASEELLDYHWHANVSPDALISFARPGLQHKTLRKLKQGLLPIEAELDLHGLNSNQARSALLQFIEHCQQRHYRCVSIIHGKSGRTPQHEPILKNKLNQWLPQLHNVLAFHSAKPKHGGTGAVYVLLKML